MKDLNTSRQIKIKTESEEQLTISTVKIHVYTCIRVCSHWCFRGRRADIIEFVVFDSLDNNLFQGVCVLLGDDGSRLGGTARKESQIDALISDKNTTATYRSISALTSSKEFSGLSKAFTSPR